MPYVYSYKKLGNDSYKVKFRLPPCETSKQDFCNKVSNAFNNKFSVVEASVKTIGKTFRENIVEAVLFENKEVKPYTEEIVNNMRVVTANVFEDENDIWTVKGEGDDRILVQTATDDFEEILKSRQTKQIVEASVVRDKEFCNLDYVSYYHPKTHDVRYGFFINLAGANVVLDREADAITPVDEEQILDAADVNEDIDRAVDTEELVEASADSGSSKEVVNVLRDLLKDTPEFFKNVEKSFEKRY